jgi:hypothetical protein
MLMLVLQLIGMGCSISMAAYYTVRIMRNGSRLDSNQTEWLHIVMAAGMAYMFLPFDNWKVIPDWLCVGVFATTTAWSLLSLRADSIGARPVNLFHLGMNLAMVYMFAQIWFDSTFVTAAFVAFFACYGTQHMVALCRRKHAGHSDNLAVDVTHLGMSALMLLMFIMPMHGMSAMGM